MNAFAITCIFAFVPSFTMGLLLIYKGTKKNASTLLGLTCVASSLFAFGAFKCALTTLESAALFWIRIAHIGIILSPAFFTHFAFEITETNKKFFIRIVYICAILFLALNFLYTDFYQIKYNFKQFYFFSCVPTENILYFLFYVLFYWFFLLYSFILLLKYYARTSGTRNTQLKYILLGAFFGWIGPEGMFLNVLGLPIYPYTNLLIGIYPFIFAYAILKYRLLDIKVAITRTALFIGIYTLILGLPFALTIFFKNWFIEKFASNWWMFPLSLMGLLATIGPFIYIYVQHRTEARLMKEQRRYQESLKHAAVGMTRIHDLKRLLKLIAHIVTRKVGISFTSIYLYDEAEGVYSLQVSHDKGRQPIAMVSSSQEIIRWFQTKGTPLIHEEIQRFAQESKDRVFKELEVEINLLDAEVIIPSFLDKRLIGFIVLGAKNTGAAYSTDDINVFLVLSSQAALAIENAQFYSEAKEMQAQISQAEKMATVGTMADGLSHQINNRFYALSLIAGDTLDTIRMTDVKNATPEVQAMVKEINTALERIQVNVMQGGEVVKGILRYTRKGDEGLVPLSIDQIIDGTLDMVQFKVKLQDFDIIRDYLKDIPKIKGNLVQMQEVFFNFIDNAYDSMVERRTMLKEPGYRGRIVLTAKPWSGIMKLSFSDNGMGVKAEDMKRLFTPFFTTKVSSRKGTGLGLYVIRSIITETHGGKISVQSEHKKGTTFTVELPIFPEKPSDEASSQNT